MEPGEFRQLANPSHGSKSHIHDVNGRLVLIGTRFAYFGRNALVIPGLIRPNIPRGQSAQGSATYDESKARTFIEFPRRPDSHPVFIIRAQSMLAPRRMHLNIWNTMRDYRLCNTFLAFALAASLGAAAAAAP
jgi:hypothetical protein